MHMYVKHTQIQYTYINRLINISSKYDELKKKSIEVDPHSEKHILTTIKYRYPQKSIGMHVYVCTDVSYLCAYERTCVKCLIVFLASSK